MTENVHQFPQQWALNLLRGDRGVMLSNYHNAVIICQQHDGIRDALIFNDFAKKAYLTHHIGAPMARYQEPQEITDKIVGEVQQWMQAIGMRSMSLDNVGRALVNTAQDHSFHPVFDYLDGLQWDGKDRIGNWLTTYLGADDTNYTRKVGPLFLISMAARIFEPGCKVDYMLVFEGDQGRLKSTTCEILFAPWFSDAMPDISTSSKDAAVHLRGKWGIEIAEMHAFNRAETTHLKSFISRTTERYRPPYGKMEVEEPRQVLFIGTTNRDTYLKDETGGRRFWPVKLGKVNADILFTDRDQLMAQAVACYRAGNNWWPDAEFERQHIKPQQDSRYETDDAWSEPISELLQTRTEVTFSDILDKLDYNSNKEPAPTDGTNFSFNGGGGGNLKTPINRIGKNEQNRIKAILISQDWERTGKQDSRGRSIWRRRPRRPLAET